MITIKNGTLFKTIPETAIKHGFAYLIAFAWAISAACAQDEPSENKRLLPERLTIETNDKYQIEETRIAGRLERLTVRRNNGFTEIYQNNSNHTIWASDESEVGDLQNLRQWRLGGW